MGPGPLLLHIGFITNQSVGQKVNQGQAVLVGVYDGDLRKGKIAVSLIAESKRQPT